MGRLQRWPWLSLMVAAGCTVEPGASLTSGTGVGTGVVVGSTDTDTGTDTDGSGDGTGGAAPADDCVTPDALGPLGSPGGAQLDRVEANAGVAIALWAQGTTIGPVDRAARMPPQRPMIVQIHATRPEPAELEARVSLQRDDGSRCVLVARGPVGPALASPPEALTVAVPAAWADAGVSWSVELGDPAGSGDPVSVPGSGPAALGITATSHRMRVVLVPIDLQGASCQKLADTSPTRRQRFHDALYEQNPLSELELEVRDPVVLTEDVENPGGISSVLQLVMMTKTADAPDDDVYYYGLFDNCGACVPNGNGCLRGLAVGEGPFSPASSLTRTAVGQAGEHELWTFVHEIGHAQGRGHVDCPDLDAGGTDSMYPHPDGATGSWGYGVLSGTWHEPVDTHDYMSLCEPAWVSPYTWGHTWDRIASLSG